VVEVIKAVRAGVEPRWIRAAVNAAAGEPDVAARLAEDWSMTVRISGDRELRRLNARFLDDDRVTDVLAFPSGDSGRGAYIGDVVASWPAVLRQAVTFGHGAEAELALLCVHGFLHLLGWDHQDADAEAEMTRLTVAALARIGAVPPPGRLSLH
jgi:probable rRNA maturation factor